MSNTVAVEGRRLSCKPVFSYDSWIEAPGRLLPCKIGDLSAEGALIKLSPDVALPARFVVRLTEDGKIKRGCRIIWQKQGFVAVRFFAMPLEKPAPGSSDQSNLERENLKTT